MCGDGLWGRGAGGAADLNQPPSPSLEFRIITNDGALREQAAPWALSSGAGPEARGNIGRGRKVKRNTSSSTMP